MSRYILETNYYPSCHVGEGGRKEPCVDCEISRDVEGTEVVYDASRGVHIVKIPGERRREGQNAGYYVCASGIDNGCEILMIGEAPGGRECDEGEPFVGPAGREIRGVIANLTGLSMNIIGWTNVLHCRPFMNATPTAQQLIVCRPKLISDIEKAKPRVIATIGAVASRIIINGITRCGGFRAMMKDHGKHFGTIEYNNALVCTIIHPAAYLHAKSTNEGMAMSILARIKDDVKHLEEVYIQAVESKYRYLSDQMLLW